MANSTIPGLVAVTVPALTDLFGVRQSGDARDKKLTVTQLLTLVPAGGDVFKVGTPANNQLGVWTGDGTIEGDANWQVVGDSLEGVLGNGPTIRNLNGVNIIPRKGDTNTGLQNLGDDRLGLVSGGIVAMKLIEASSAVLQLHQTNVGITAFAGGGSVSATQLNSSYNVVSTVATTGDSVKLSTTLEVGVVNYVKNDGANAMDLFPAAGDDLGFGVGVAISVGAGASVAFLGTVTGSVSTQLMFEIPAAGGDVTKVGTPVNNQIGVWTGDGTLEGDPSLLWSGTILTVGGTIRVANNGGGAILNEQVTSTNPSIITDVGDTDTGFGSGGGNSIVLIVGAQAYVNWRATGAGDGSLEATYDLTTGKTASTIQTQGQAVQNSPEYSEITTVANPNDVITLGGATVGRKITIVNKGANVLQIFPASGADLGQGLNASTTLAVDHSITFFAVTGAFWATIGLSNTGDVTKVGTPVDNQVGVWTGDGTIEGTTGLIFDGTKLDIDGNLDVNDINIQNAAANGIVFALGGGPQIRNVASTSTVPTILPNKTDLNTGLGLSTLDALSIIAGGVEIAQATEAGATSRQFIVTPGMASQNTPATPQLQIGSAANGFYQPVANVISVALAGVQKWSIQADRINSAGSGAAIEFGTPSATDPSLVPNGTDLDTGIGWTSADILSLVAGGVEGFTVAEVGAVITNTFRGDLKAAGGGGAGPMMVNTSASSSVPTLIPNQADPDTGLTRDSINGLSMVAGGLGCIRARNIGAARAVGFYTTTPIIQQTGVAVSSAGIHAALVALGLITA